MRHLVFQIASPLSAWGSDHARRDRPTDGHPRKSEILGLLGAAMGLARSDPWHRTSGAALGFAVAVLRAGTRMADYHTVAVPPAGKAWPTRREELGASDYTVETVREYLSDACFVVAIWEDPRGPGCALGPIAEALGSPKAEIFAGRKACTLSLPPAPLVADAGTLAEAFRAYRPRLYPPLFGAGRLECRAYWGEHPAPGIPAAGTAVRNDEPVDLARRIWRSREEHEGTLVLGEG